MYISSVPVSFSIELYVSTVGAKNLADWFFLVQDDALEIVTWMLLYLIEYDFAGEVMFGVGEGALSEFFYAGGTDESSAELVGRIGAFDHSAICKFHSSLAFVSHGQRV